MPIQHLDGQPVTIANPARRCEIVKLVPTSAYDADRCDAPGCPLPEQQALDPRPKIVSAIDNGAPGQFGCIDNGQFEIKEMPAPPGLNINEPVAGGCLFYRVGLTQEDPVVSFGSFWDDSGKVLLDGGEATGFNDDPWGAGGGASMAVAPQADCWIQDLSGVDPGDRDACKQGTAQSGNSTITPLDGNVSFQVPVTSWKCRGQRYPLTLTYNSNSARAAMLFYNQPWHPAALSDKDQKHNYNPKWTHTYAQWVEVTLSGHALWHRGDGTTIAFEQYWNGAEGPFWRTDESYHTLTSTGQSQSPTLYVEGKPYTITVPYAHFTLRDAAGTTYRFMEQRWHVVNSDPWHNYAVPPLAMPSFLMTSITDRWGRQLDIAWGNHAAGFGVNTVRDVDNRGLTFAYNTDGLVSSVTDAHGRVHSLQYSQVLQPLVFGLQYYQPKLTGVTVYGAGSPNRSRYDWSFSYLDASTQYGGTYTGDLVTSKTTPTGKTVEYYYAPINFVGTLGLRATNDDYDGKLTKTRYLELTGGVPALMEIVRQGNKLIYPGGNCYNYTYSGHHLSSVTHENTGASVQYTWDDKHNLTNFGTGSGSLVTLN